MLTPEQILSIFIDTEPTARSRYKLYGYPPMWKIITLDETTSVFARPSKTVEKHPVTQRYVEVDGIAFGLMRNGEWFGQELSCTVEYFCEVELPQLIIIYC